MSLQLRLLYDSSNGDRWYIWRDEADRRLFIRHEPNRASGGRPVHFSLREFLAQQQGPQHEAFLTILSRLLEPLLDEEQPGGKRNAVV